VRYAGCLIALSCLGAPLTAQISPGPLAAPHRQLEGALQCAACHGGGRERKEQMNARCLACHKEIVWLVDRGRGFHGGVKDQRCATCHPDHAGREFALVNWPGGDPQRFDHDSAGWPLDGSHQTTKCLDCHKPAFRVSRAAKLSERRGPAWGWIGLERTCVSCHEDIHRGRLGTACADCHTTTDFKTIARGKFDHEHTRYPLRGRHRAVACEKCHDFSGGKVVSSPRFANCTDCHTDAHAGTATLAGRSVDCASCHVVDDWRPATYTVAQHRNTRYPLEGKHQQVKCADCHVTNPPGVPAARLGTAGVVMRPVATKCRDCHGEDHGSQLASRPDSGACSVCHTVAGWTPSTFTASRHETLHLKLEGRHAEIACAACHGPDRRGLPTLPAAQALGKAGVAFKLKEIECAACHVDPHDGRYPRCADCHAVRSFRPSTVDIATHKRYTFALDGAHAAVACVECHGEMKHPAATSSLVLARWVFPRLLFAAPKNGCQGCHENPHGTQFAARMEREGCEVCHGTDVFRPATHFDHNRDATFALKGAHENVPCDRCHISTRRPDGTTVVIYRPVSGKCEACHGEKVRRGS
jgi:hypothetical protein